MNYDEFSRLGFPVDEPAFQRLSAYVAALLDENSRINLTGCKDPEEFWRIHICDSLALTQRVATEPPVRLLDLGAGGGLPGVPIACVRLNWLITLLDSTRKKLDAVSRIVSQIGLSNVKAVWSRAEALGRSPAARAQFDIVTARAVAALPTLVEWSAPFLRDRGEAWFFKSIHAAGDEIAAAADRAEQVGLQYVETRPYDLPAGGGPRCFVIYRKQLRPPSRGQRPVPRGRS